MKIIGLVAVSRFPLELLKITFDSLSNQCEEIHVRLDPTNHVDPGFFSIYDRITLIRGLEEWNRYNWREELIRSVDDKRPDIVLTPDQDEVFEPSLSGELVEFWSSQSQAIMFEYSRPMPTDDGRIILNGNSYPKLPHMLGFKWKPRLTYVPYCGLCQPTQYANGQVPVWKARSRVSHYCMFTQEMERSKIDWATKEYGPGEFA
jgi:hypothetical protein